MPTLAQPAKNKISQGQWRFTLNKFKKAERRK
jgi:hypothetical protein